MEYCLDCSAEMNYIGNKEWECTNCHTIYENDGIEYEDEDDGERLSVWDAAAIWRSHGNDEEYMFDYSEEEL